MSSDDDDPECFVEPEFRYTHTDHIEQCTNWKTVMAMWLPSEFWKSNKKELNAAICADIDRTSKLYRFSDITDSDLTEQAVERLESIGSNFEWMMKIEEQLKLLNPMSFTDCFFNRSFDFIKSIMHGLDWRCVANQPMEIHVGRKHTTVGFRTNRLLIIKAGIRNLNTIYRRQIAQLTLMILRTNVASLTLVYADARNDKALLLREMKQLYYAIRENTVIENHAGTVVKAHPNCMERKIGPNFGNSRKDLENPEMKGTCAFIVFERPVTPKFVPKNLTEYFMSLFGGGLEYVEDLPTSEVPYIY